MTITKFRSTTIDYSIDSGHAEDAQAQLENNILPRVKEFPGVVAGYWTRSADGEQGSSMVVFESEEAARAAAENIPNMQRPDFITFDNVEVREVVAHI